MRVKESRDGFSVKAYAGTTGVLLAMNLPKAKAGKLLGFAIEREAPGKPVEWLRASLPFPHMLPDHRPGMDYPTNIAPVQKFRWSDYRVWPDREYAYTVHPVYGTPEQPDVRPGVTVEVRTASAATGEQRVLFTRAAAASQAFAKKFPQLLEQIDNAPKGEKKNVVLPPEALEWLTRGVVDLIVDFIGRAADPGWALDIAIYEYEEPRIVRAVNAAHARGVRLRIVYHRDPPDDQARENEHHLAALPAECKHARPTGKIFHHKFIVLSRVTDGVRQPAAVLCGSTNFTHNGVYRQANVVHALERPDVASAYLALFEHLLTAEDAAATRAYVAAHNPMDPDAPLFAGFSPRRGGADIATFVAEIGRAKRDVLFCTAFGLHPDVSRALLGKAHDPILRYGVQNTRSAITGFHADRTASFSATAMLNRGLEGWLKESTAGQKGNILIHTKLVIVDFTSDRPTVISGSHNLSQSASSGNDENFLILRGDTDVADSYGCELMRLYDHYRFRWFVKQDTAKTNKKKKKPPQLTPDGSWTRPYYSPKNSAERLKQQDRLRFAG